MEHIYKSDELQMLFARFSPLETEMIPLAEGLGRVLADDSIRAGEQLPPFSRASMDGFAVRAEDTFSCSTSEPVGLKVIGEIMMGSPGTVYSLQPGQAVKIWTGGELPEQGNGVVMIEQTRLTDAQVQIFRPISPGENIIGAGDDFKPESIVFPKNQAGNKKKERKNILRPLDLGVMAGLGKTELRVHKRVRVGIISSGNELVPPESSLEPGKIRDINGITMSALAQEAGAIPTGYGIIKDDPEQMLRACEQALAENDLLLVTGGSSAGKRDFTRRVFANIKGCEVLKDDAVIRQGKSTLLAIRGNQAVVGLPGHTAPAILIFYLFIRPLIRKLSGLSADPGLTKIAAITGQPVFSRIDREEAIRVSLNWHGNKKIPVATPVYGKSALLRPLMETDALLVINKDIKELAVNTVVKVFLFPNP